MRRRGWGGGEPGAEGSLGRKGAWGGGEVGAEGRLGRRGGLRRGGGRGKEGILRITPWNFKLGGDCSFLGSRIQSGHKVDSKWQSGLKVAVPQPERAESSTAGDPKVKYGKSTGTSFGHNTLAGYLASRSDTEGRRYAAQSSPSAPKLRRPAAASLGTKSAVQESVLSLPRLSRPSATLHKSDRSNLS